LFFVGHPDKNRSELIASNLVHTCINILAAYQC
jgi:hypothetical protein